MSDSIKVTTTIEVDKICTNCLYCGCNGVTCGHAGNRGQIMLLVNGGHACQYFWLDQHKFPNAESRK